MPEKQAPGSWRLILCRIELYSILEIALGKVCNFFDMKDESTEKEFLARKPYLNAYYAGSVPTREGPERAVARLARTAAGGWIAEYGEAEGESPARALASRRTPEREAERRLAGLRESRDTEIVLILGLGNPALLPGSAELAREKQICIALDASFSLGREICRDYPDALLFLNRPGSHLFCGREMEESYRSYIESAPLERFSGLRVIRHRPSIDLDPEFYERQEEFLKKSIQTRLSDLLTRFEFEKNWIRNIIINSRHLPPLREDPASGERVAAERAGERADTNPAKAAKEEKKENSDPRFLQRYENALQGTPGLLVAAGPSLRASLPLVRELQNRCFVLSCDTAFKALLKGGVEPHGVAVLDAQAHTQYHFFGETSLRKAILFSDLVVHPRVLAGLEPGGAVFSITAKYLPTLDGTFRRESTPGSEHIERISGNVGDVQTGGSVATTAFEILRFLGCSPILLVGQDLAYTGREIHSTGTHHNERWLTKVSRLSGLEHINEAIIRKRRIFNTTALDGGEVMTDYVLDMYRHWFEDALPRAGVRTINLGGAGARIAGAERVEHPLEFVRALPVLKNPGAVFSEAPPPETFRHELNGSLMRLLEKTLQGPEAERRSASEELYKSFPYLKALHRKTEIYIKRNRDRLSAEKALELEKASERKELQALYRAILPYFGEDGD